MQINNYMGNTPIVKINNIYGEKYGNVWVKLEEFNPGGSIKSRVGLNMITDAEQRGLLKSGDRIIEATGGNTGLGLALSSSIKGYDLTLIIPDNFSREKIKILKAFGAKVILSDHSSGPGSHVRLLKDIISEEKGYVHLDQFSNMANPRAHYLYTGNEIIDQMKGNVSAFVSVIGSGGTITGVGKRLKEHNSNIRVIGVQPAGCDLINGVFVPHKIEAIAVGVVSPFIEKERIDSMVDVDFDEVQDIRDYLCRKQGIFVGLSSGANIISALKLSKKYTADNNIVTVSPDSGRSYL
ncbi:PLP-dependent cysteine synthase family protein [Dickeya oryzae]